MTAPASCSEGDHRPPSTGGSCSCGMVTMVPARCPAPPLDVRDLLARCLADGSGGPAAAIEPAVLHERADRVLAALADAGLVLARDAGTKLPA